jgi:hypothetical protein
MASLAEVSKYGMLPFDWHQAIARFCVTYTRFTSSVPSQDVRTPTAYLPLVLLNVNLISEDDKREIFSILRVSLDEELVPPRIEGLKGFGRVDVVDKDTAVGSTIECDTKGLEAFLTSGIPKLGASEFKCACQPIKSGEVKQRREMKAGPRDVRFSGKGTYLHSDETVIDHDLLGEAKEKGSGTMRSARRARARDEKNGQVSAYCCLVLVVEAFIDVLVHQRRLADAASGDGGQNVSVRVYGGGGTSSNDEE